MTTSYTFKRDNNDNDVQATTSFVTIDASGTPKTSPVAYSSTAITITVPTNSVDVSLTPTTDMLVSEDPNMASTYLIPANSEKVIGIGRMTTFYIKRSTADGSCYFEFNLL